MAIEEVLASNTPNEGRVIWNDNFIDLEGRLNELNPDGPTWIFQSGAPDDLADGFDGDMYYDTATQTIYGPKTDGLWGSGTTINIPDATEGAKGKIEIATQTETDTGTDDSRAITPLKLANYSGLGGGGGSAASETVAGIAEIATQTETDTGTDDARIVTPLKAATRFLAKAGGTLTGFLTLHADPSSAMHAVTKQYADGLVSGGASPASETVAGIAEIATQTETNTGTDDARIVTPLKLASRTSTETRAGVVELATDTETQTGTDTARAITPANLSARTSTETRTGVVELATDGETQTGTDTARAITPANLSARSATETRSGIAEIATQTETDTGTDDARIVTPLKAATRFLAKAGGTLTGFLTLHADPSSAMHAVTKQYADALVVGGASPASETVAGIAEIATQTETDTGTDDARIVTPLKLANYSGLGAGSGYRTLVTLGSDVVNATTSFADVTGLSFSATSGTMYRFEALILFDVNATTTGARWAINGPASPTFLAYTAQWPNSATGLVSTNASTYDAGTASSQSPFTAGNVAYIRGLIQTSTTGTVIVRFASEVAVASALTAKAGSTLEYW